MKHKIQTVMAYKEVKFALYKKRTFCFIPYWSLVDTFNSKETALEVRQLLAETPLYFNSNE